MGYVVALYEQIVTDRASNMIGRPNLIDTLIRDHWKRLLNLVLATELL
jgi:hypothetical protein